MCILLKMATDSSVHVDNIDCDENHDEDEIEIVDVTTRWNSTFYILEWILKQQQPLCATLLGIHRADLMPNNGEISIMEAFVEVMRLIAEITEVMGEKHVTLSAVRIFLYKLLNKHLMVKPTDSNVQKR